LPRGGSFQIKNDIDEVLESNNNLIIFGGDFNTGSNNSNLEHKQRYTKLCEKISKFTDISNGNPKYNQNTSFWYDNRFTRKGYFMRNDFCFVNKIEYIKYHSGIYRLKMNG